MAVTEHEDYQQKLNRGWARLPIPWDLKAMALKQLMTSLSQVSHPVSDVQLAQLREYVQTNLLPEFLPEIIRLAQYSLIAPSSLMNVLYAFPPQVYATTLDLLKFYEGTECCDPNNSNNWMFGYLPDICLDKKACLKLVNLINMMDASQLRTLRFWAANGSINDSLLPHTLTQLVNLTSLTIRGDMTDNILRLVGGACSNLKILDIGRSVGVTEIGLFNMLIAHPVRRRRNGLVPVADIGSCDRRPIAATLTSLALTVGTIPLNMIQYLANMLSSYVVTCLPDAKLLKKDVAVCPAAAGSHSPLYALRSTSIDGRLEPLQLNIVWGSDPSTFDDCFKAWMPTAIWSSTRDLLTFTVVVVGGFMLDVYRDSASSVFIFIHRPFSTFLHSVYKLSKTQGLTDLALFWDTFNWDFAHIPHFADLITFAPNLITYQGRLSGTWGGSRLVLHHLTYINCWILDDRTVISILKWCPSLEVVDIKNIRSFENRPGARAEPPTPFTDAVLPVLFETNRNVWPKLREVMIRPTNLTRVGVLALVEKCPNLLRLGDLECWHVSNEELLELNQLLFTSKCQCSLVVLSFPPSRIIN